MAPEDSDDKTSEYLGKDGIGTINRVLMFKASKLDQIEKDTNDSNREVYSCIADFLRTDLEICRIIVRIDYTVRESIITGFRDIIKVLEASPAPTHQAEYIELLTPEESFLEYSYAQTINRLQGIMMYMKDEFLH